MESVVSAVCVILTAVIVYYAIEKPYRPKLVIGCRRAPGSVIFCTALLSRECARGERGHGVNCGHVFYVLRREIKSIDKKLRGGIRLSDTEKIFYETSERLTAAIECALRLFDDSASLPHVRGIPRVFLFCEKLVEWTMGAFSDDLLRDAVAEFCKNAELERRERRLLPHALRVCLVCEMLAVIKRVRAREEEFARGASDGKEGRVDLSALGCHEYIYGAASSDSAELMRLTDINGVSAGDAELAYKKETALDFSAMSSMLDAFSVVDGLAIVDADDGKDIRSTRATIKDKFIHCLPCIMSFICGVLLVLLNALTAGYLIVDIIGAALLSGAFAPLFARKIYNISRQQFLRNRKTKHANVQEKDLRLSYFGGESEYRTNELIALGTSVLTDNRGGVSFAADGKVACDIAIAVECNGRTAKLCEFDGVYEEHRTVYRLATDTAEYIAEVIATVSGGALAVKMTVINRTDSDICVKKALSCAPKPANTVCGKLREVRKSGAALPCGICETAIFCDAPSEFFTKKNVDGVDGQTALFCNCSITASAFSSVSVVFVVVVTALNVPLYNIFDLMRDVYFDRERYAACAFAKLNKKQSEEVPETEQVLLNDPSRFRGAKKSESRFKRVLSLQEHEGEREALIDDGIAVLSADCKNILTDGEFCAEVYANGNSEESYSGERITGESVGGLRSITVSVCEDGYIWSPYDGGETLFGRGFCQNVCGENGCVTTLKRFIAREKRAEVFLLCVEDKSGQSRRLSVMFSVAASGMRAFEKDNAVYAMRDGERRGFAIFSSEKISEYTAYAEGFFRRGVIDRTAGFLPGGSTCAPTVSVEFDVPPNGSKNIAFCLAVFDNGVKLDGISVESAREYERIEREYYNGYSRIKLCSTDETLNVAHAYSLYAAYTSFLRDKNNGRHGRALAECFAAKYADSFAVGDYLRELCKIQEPCGRVSEKDLTATLLLPLAVKDYVDYSCDGLFLTEELSFKNVGGITTRRSDVLEHCLRAIDYAMLVAAQSRAANKPFRHAPLLYAAVRTFLPYLPISNRRKQYSKILSELRAAVVQTRRKIASADIEFDALGGATAFSRYALGDDEGGYEVIKELITCGVENAVGQRFFSDDGVASSLVFVAITEKLLGVGIRGSRAKISPKTTAGTPHIEFELDYGETSTHITVDDTEEFGAWQINADRVTYATDCIKLTEQQDIPIIFRRSGVKSL